MTQKVSPHGTDKVELFIIQINRCSRANMRLRNYHVISVTYRFRDTRRCLNSLSIIISLRLSFVYITQFLDSKTNFDNVMTSQLDIPAGIFDSDVEKALKNVGIFRRRYFDIEIFLRCQRFFDVEFRRLNRKCPLGKRPKCWHTWFIKIVSKMFYLLSASLDFSLFNLGRSFGDHVVLP